MIELMARASNSNFDESQTMRPNEKRWHAVQTRDRGADGAFVYAVRLTEFIADRLALHASRGASKWNFFHCQKPRNSGDSALV